MKHHKAFIAGKLSEPCTCSSGSSYRDCCYHRECVYFVVGVFAALVLFGAREWPQLLFGLPILLLATLAAKWHYDRKRRQQSQRPL